MRADVFLDSNVLLHIVSSEVSKADRTEALCADGAVISVQVLNEFANVALRRFAMSISEIQHVLSRVRATCSVLPLDVGVHQCGLDLADRHRFSIYDSMIVASALLAGCRVLYSEDFNDGQVIDGLTIHNPFR